MKPKLLLTKSFPPELHDDVLEVLCRLDFHENDISNSEYDVFVKGSLVTIPERVYFIESNYYRLSHIQRIILDCILTRHHNGFVRQKHVRNLLNCSEYWIIPFTFRLLGEYVEEILCDIECHIYENLKEYREFIDENIFFFEKTQSRIISYWNCYYRSKYPKFESYIGYRIIEKLL